MGSADTKSILSYFEHGNSGGPVYGKYGQLELPRVS